MSGDWVPIHHTDGEDPDNEPAKGPTVEQREGAHTDSKPKTDNAAPVALTLNLPPDMIAAVWANSDQVLRLAIAVEENTKAIREAMKGKT